MRYFIPMITVAFLVAGIGTEPHRGNPGDTSLRLISCLIVYERRRRAPHVSLSGLMAVQSRPDRNAGRSYRYAV
jgi:hypothetical protein